MKEQLTATSSNTDYDLSSKDSLGREMDFATVPSSLRLDTNSMTHWHLFIANRQLGPFREDDILIGLAESRIFRDTPIWCDQLTDWTLIESLELFRPFVTMQRSPSYLDAILSFDAEARLNHDINDLINKRGLFKNGLSGSNAKLVQAPFGAGETGVDPDLHPGALESLFADSFVKSNSQEFLLGLVNPSSSQVAATSLPLNSPQPSKEEISATRPFGVSISRRLFVVAIAAMGLIAVWTYLYPRKLDLPEIDVEARTRLS